MASKSTKAMGKQIVVIAVGTALAGVVVAAGWAIYSAVTGAAKAVVNSGEQS